MSELRRRCRACGKTSTVSHATPKCPRCKTPYGGIVFGLDLSPDEASAMERVRRADTEATYRRRMTEVPSKPSLPGEEPSP